MRAMASARSTGSSSGPMSEVLESFATTKSIVENKRSHQDFYSAGLRGSPHKERLAHKGISRKGLRLS